MKRAVPVKQLAARNTDLDAIVGKLWEGELNNVHVSTAKIHLIHLDNHLEKLIKNQHQNVLGVVMNQLYLQATMTF